MLRKNSDSNIIQRLLGYSIIRFLLSVAAIVLLIYLFTGVGLWMHSK